MTKSNGSKSRNHPSSFRSMNRSALRSSEQIRQFMVAMGVGDPVEAVRKRANELVLPLEGPPYNLDCPQVRRAANIKDVRYSRDLAPDGRIFWDKGGYVVEIKAVLALPRRVFTLAHEIGHTFFLQCNGTGQSGRTDVRTEKFVRDNEEEFLCDVAASEMLMPTDSFVQRVCSYGPSIKSILQLAKDFGTSLTAVARRFAESDIWPCHIGLWRVLDGKTPVFESGFRSPTCGLHLPAGSIAAPNSVVARTVELARSIRGWSDIGLVDHVGEPAGKVFVEALYLKRLKVTVCVAILAKYPESLCKMIEAHKEQQRNKLSSLQPSFRFHT